MSNNTSQRTRIKICGITNIEDVKAAIEAGADAIGFVFAPRSPRCITLDKAIEIGKVVGPFITTVALYQNPKITEPTLTQWLGDWLQLHGEEDEDFLSQLRRCVIKGFQFDPEQVRRWDNCPHVDALLIDGSSGGKGQSFDHTALAKMRDEIEKPIILAGGLTPENVSDAIRTVHPYAVDVSSGVEESPGRKDPELMHAICRAVREADQELTNQRAS